MKVKHKFVGSVILLAFVATGVVSSGTMVAAKDDLSNAYTEESSEDLKKSSGKVNNLAKENVKIEVRTAVGESEKDGKNKSEKVEDISLAEGLGISTGSASVTLGAIAGTKNLIKHFVNGKKDVPSLVPTDNPVTDQDFKNEEKDKNEEPAHGIKGFYKNKSLGITIPVTIFAIYFMYVILFTIATVIRVYVLSSPEVEYKPLYGAFKIRSFVPDSFGKALGYSFLAHLALSRVSVYRPDSGSTESEINETT